MRQLRKHSTLQLGTFVARCLKRMVCAKTEVAGASAVKRRSTAGAVAIKLHLQRDPPQVTSFLHHLERDGYVLRYLNYDGDIAPTNPAIIVANPQEH